MTLGKVVILRCDCSHKFQDNCYGRHRRVHNVKKSNYGTGVRCTVCGNERVINA